MGVYIKGMEMPPNCCQCPVNMEVCKRGYEYLLAHPELYDKRASDCPLIPVPPHGRCIDADALEYEEAYLNGHYELGDVEIVTREDIESAPTIISAEEEDSNVE